MMETWLIIIEFLKVIAILAIFPAQLAWSLMASGSGFSILLGIGIIIGVYGGMIVALIRSIRWILLGRPAPSRRRRRRTSR